MDGAECTDAAVEMIREELIRLIAGAAVTFDQLRRDHPAWFAGDRALAYEGVVLCSGLAAAIAAALGRELAPAGRLLATRVYLVGRAPQRSPITKERRHCRTSRWWPIQLELRSRRAA